VVIVIASTPGPTEGVRSHLIWIVITGMSKKNWTQPSEVMDNWTANAFDHNVAEEASFCDDKSIAQAYYSQFRALWDQCWRKGLCKRWKR
jgi:DNA-binding transcriptional regulator PaaX